MEKLEEIRELFEEFKTTTGDLSEIAIDEIINRDIREPLAALGKTMKDLSDSDDSTDRQMEDVLQLAINRIRVQTARFRFAEFETQPKSSIVYSERLIRATLEKAGEPLYVLDPSLKPKNAAEQQTCNKKIEARLQLHTARLRIMDDPEQFENLRKAYQIFREIQANATGNNISGRADKIETLLASIYAPLAMLDPSYKSTNEEIQAQIDEAVKRGHLFRARTLFNKIVDGTDAYHVRVNEGALRSHLTEAGVTISALKKGSTDEEMQARLDAAVKNNHLLRARALFDKIEAGTDLDNAEDNKMALEGHLHDAKATISALEKESTDEEMQDRLDRAMIRNHALKIAKDFSNPTTAGTIRDAQQHLRALDRYLPAQFGGAAPRREEAYACPDAAEYVRFIEKKDSKPDTYNNSTNVFRNRSFH